MTSCDVEDGLSKAVDCKLELTKIPVPISIFKHSSGRRYKHTMLTVRSGNNAKPTSVNSRTCSLSNLVCDDSGVQLDCSASSEESAVRISCSTPELEQVSSGDKLKMISSQLELDIAEQSTLRELQRAVAEMEADVQLHADALEEEVQQEAKQLAVNEIVSHLLDDVTDEPAAAAVDAIEIVAAGSASPRRLVHVEDLLEAQTNMKPLLQLLQGHIDANADPEDPANDDPLARAEKQLSLDVAVNTVPKKQMGFLCALLQFACIRRVTKFSYPLLVCCMIVGLTYYFRRV